MSVVAPCLTVIFIPLGQTKNHLFRGYEYKKQWFTLRFKNEQKSRDNLQDKRSLRLLETITM